MYCMMQRIYKLGCPHGRVPCEVDVCVKFAAEFTTERGDGDPADMDEALVIAFYAKQRKNTLNCRKMLVSWSGSYHTSCR